MPNHHRPEEATNMDTTCPACDRPAVGKAFAATSAYVRCSLGHVWADLAPLTAEATAALAGMQR